MCQWALSLKHPPSRTIRDRDYRIRCAKTVRSHRIQFRCVYSSDEWSCSQKRSPLAVPLSKSLLRQIFPIAQKHASHLQLRCKMQAHFALCISAGERSQNARSGTFSIATMWHIQGVHENHEITLFSTPSPFLPLTKHQILDVMTDKEGQKHSQIADLRSRKGYAWAIWVL
jgi:hypothetical protein